MTPVLSMPDGVRLNFAAQGGLSGGVFLVVRHGSHLPVGVQHQLDKGAFIGNVLPRCHVHDAVQREQRADIVLAGGFDPAVLAVKPSNSFDTAIRVPTTPAASPTESVR